MGLCHTVFAFALHHTKHHTNGLLIVDSAGIETPWRLFNLSKTSVISA